MIVLLVLLSLATWMIVVGTMNYIARYHRSKVPVTADILYRAKSYSHHDTPRC